MRRRVPVCKFWVVGSFVLMLLAVSFGIAAVALTSWVIIRGRSSALGDDLVEVVVGLLRVCYTQPSGDDGECDSLVGSASHPPVWFRSTQMLVLTGQIGGAIITLLTGLHLPVPVLLNARVGMALGFGAACAGTMILLGVASSAGNAVKLRELDSLALLSPAISTILEDLTVETAEEVILGTAHYLNLVSALLHLLGGAVSIIASMVENTGWSSSGTSAPASMEADDRPRPLATKFHLSRMNDSSEQGPPIKRPFRERGFSMTMWDINSSPSPEKASGFFTFFRKE